MRLLSGAGADIDAPDASGSTANQAAARSGAFAVTQFLVKLEADVKRKDANNKTLLPLLSSFSAFDKNPNTVAQDTINRILKHGIDLHALDPAKKNGRTALPIAQAHGIGRMIKVLEAAAQGS